MPLKNAVDLINDSSLRSLPSFDVGGGNIEFIKAAFKAAEKTNGSMFLASTPSTVKNYLGFDKYVKTINMIGVEYDVDYAIHLDHASEVIDAKLALEAGFSSVMYDGSHHDIQLNIKNTLEVIEYAKKYGATVEAELGQIAGKEDEIECDSSSLPSLEEILSFQKQTNTDLMAPAVGTVHGFFKGEPKINWDVINQLPFDEHKFVLHGCTGVDFDLIQKLSEKGFVKFNFATALRDVFRKALIESIKLKPDNLKPYLYLNEACDVLSDYMIDIFFLFKANK